MKKITKILSLILSATLLISTVAACKKDNKEGNSVVADMALPSNLDYSQSDKKFRYFGYSALNEGQFTTADDTYNLGYSFLNEYYISEYFDTGMDMLLAQSAAPMGGSIVSQETYESSDLKKTLDIAHELGHDNSVVITDNYLYQPYHSALSYANAQKLTKAEDITLFGDLDWQFASEEELDAYMMQTIKYYYQEPAFGGLMVMDEPPAKMLQVVGQWYKALRRIQAKLGIEEMEINANLLPYYPGLVAASFPEVEESFHSDKEQRDHEAYRRYLDDFLKYSDAKNLQIDIYPMIDTGVYRMYVLNLQIAAETAKKYGSKIVIVNQTTTYNNTRIMSYEDLQYVNNIVMGFGAENIGYYTFFTADGSESYNFNDWGSMMTHFGEKTDVYYRVQKLIAEGQKLAPVILNYDYVTSKTYTVNTPSSPLTTYSDHMMKAEKYEGNKNFAEFTKLKDFSVNKEMAVVTELYDDEKENYMYMVMNTSDPMFKGSTTYETATATFSEEYTHVWVYFKGEYTVWTLDQNHAFTMKMHPSEAYYIMPFKA